ncbi:DUF4232 domain-containing protein [Streptomyces sp. NPDC047017]|uniref:DUF4232 domain-containing protein n=1 Tax=Streptomyces sp. NPDC047017 TaxID=3155024 RepID=UPI0033CC266E
MSARTLRTRLLAASALCVAALSLTACGGGNDTNGAAASTPVAAAQSGRSASDAPSAQGGSGTSAQTSGSGGGARNGSHTGGTSGKGKAATGGSHSGGGDGSDEFTKCSAKHLRITAVSVPRPINHLLLRATNTGSRRCMLEPYPAARFGEAQSVPPVAEDTKPQALVSLEPGESGYAGVKLSGDGDHGHTVRTLTVPLEDGSIATVKLPAAGVHVDDSLTVTYWQSTTQYVVDF